jgi:hypothetical protein
MGGKRVAKVGEDIEDTSDNKTPYGRWDTIKLIY